MLHPLEFCLSTAAFRDHPYVAVFLRTPMLEMCIEWLFMCCPCMSYYQVVAPCFELSTASWFEPLTVRMQSYGPLGMGNSTDVELYQYSVKYCNKWS